MYQRWRSLLFLHFPCPSHEIQALLPPGLEVETFPDAAGADMAWVGLVPFRMEGVRPRFLPPVPGLSAFPETNVRTYVRHKGERPGVWFFSLDADQPLACKLARRFFGLPYREAKMEVIEEDDHRTYGARRSGGAANHRIEATFGDPVAIAEPGTLEFFLVERYLLYAYRDGALFTGRVHHRPYPLRAARVETIEESMVAAAGISPRPFVHVMASDGVDVDVFPLSAL